MSPLPNQAFTTRYNGRALRLTNEVEIFPAFPPNATPLPGKKYLALYDTGATHSAISPKVVQELNLPSVGARRVGVGGGFHDTTSHLVNIKLPSNVLCPMFQVAQIHVPSGEDVIIGMDVLAAGDFAVTNQGGNTVFSFRVPSQKCIDFVAEINDQRAKSTAHRPSKNGPCPCGNGKKYKSCHGRHLP
jgi:predicted aspartyl protease